MKGSGEYKPPASRERAGRARSGGGASAPPPVSTQREQGSGGGVSPPPVEEAVGRDRGGGGVSAPPPAPLPVRREKEGEGDISPPPEEDWLEEVEGFYEEEWRPLPLEGGVARTWAELRAAMAEQDRLDRLKAGVGAPAPSAEVDMRDVSTPPRGKRSPRKRTGAKIRSPPAKVGLPGPSGAGARPGGAGKGPGVT